MRGMEGSLNQRRAATSLLLTDGTGQARISFVYKIAALLDLSKWKDW